MSKKHYKTISLLLKLTILLFFINIFFADKISSLMSPTNQSMNVVNLQGGPSVMLIPIEGAISGATSGFILDSLRKIKTMSNIKGIILKINSPGGTTGTSQEIYNELMEIRKTGIKIVSVIGDVGASGGYYAASASDVIVANGSSLTASIGVIMSTMNFKGIADKFGVKSITFTSGKMKDMLSPFRDVRADEEAYIQKMIQTIYNQFVGDVLLGRNGSSEKITKEKLLAIADGRVMTGIDAKAAGLIDVLGGYSTAQEEMKKLLNTKTLSISNFSKGYMSQLVEVLTGGMNNLSKINPASQIGTDQFLKQHLDTPLYYSSLGGL